MAIEQELRHLLAQRSTPQAASRNQDLKEQNGDLSKTVVAESTPSPREIYSRLVKARDQIALPLAGIATRANLPELLALIAESAVREGDFAVANECVEWFLSESNVRNQFYCRMQLVRAHCASNDAAQDCSALKLRKVLNAIRYILLVIPIALNTKRRPQYDFLVYNASVTYWQIARQLMKKSSFQYLAPSLTTIVDALKTVGEKDIQWTTRLQLSLVFAQIDGKLMAAAVKRISELVDTQLTPLANDPVMASDPGFKTLYEEAVRVQLHLASMKDPECQKLAGSMKKNTTTKRLELVNKLQALKSGSFTGTVEAALTELLQETLGLPSFTPSSSTDDQIVTHLQGLDTASQQAVDAEIIVEAGMLAAFRQEFRIAACCDVVLQVKGKTMTPKFRALHQVLKAILLALVPPPASANFKLNQRQRAALFVSRRMDGVKAIERALLVCKVQNDPQLMESVCLYAWNLSQPLLQPGMRGQLSRLFSLAASSLEELQSMQLTLRVRLLLEAAKIEMSADFMSKAQDNVSKALRLDYGSMSATSVTAPTLDELTKQEAKWLSRAADVHLLPLKHRLDRKLSLQDPENLEEELSSAVDELKDAKDDNQRRCLADRVLSIVGRRQAEQQASVSLDVLLHLHTACAIVWHELKDTDMARALANEALAVFKQLSESAANEPESLIHDKSVRLLEVDLTLRIVEILGCKIKTRLQRYQLAVDEHAASQGGNSKRRVGTHHSKGRGYSHGKKSDDTVNAAALLLLSKESHALGLGVTTTSGDNQSPEVNERYAALEAELLTLKKEVVHELVGALQAASQIGWGFLVENSAVYMWNYHFHVFRRLLTEPGAAAASAILPDCITAFEATLAALEALPVANVSQDLLASVALGLALIHEKLGHMDKAIAIADNILKRQKASTAVLPSASTPTVSVALLKGFTELQIRIQLHQNAKEITPVDAVPALRVVSFLEAMEGMLSQATTTPPAAPLVEKANGYTQKAMAAWQPIARESLDRVKNDALSLEEQQQSLVLYCEVWVRLGCGAFRFQQTKQAIECGEKALESLRDLSDDEQQVWGTGDAWRWLAIAELLCGRSILTLLSGETAAWPLIDAVLSHLVKAMTFGLRAGATSVVTKAADVAWNTTLTAMAAVEAERALGEASDSAEEVAAWKRLLFPLRSVLDGLGQIAGASHQLGEFGLLVLDVCEKAGEWKAAIEVADSLIHRPATAAVGEVQPDHLKDITTFHAIAVATTGGSGAGGAASGGKSKDHDALVQAKIWKRIAFSSRRSPPSQLKALAMAFKELEDKLEEKAGVLLDIAEWFFTHNFPVVEVHAHVDAAITTLLHAQEARNAANKRSMEGSAVQYAPSFFTDKLLRAFVTRAVVATSMSRRWEAVRNAMHQVYSMWQGFVDFINDQDLRERHQQEDPAIEFDEWKVDKSTKLPAQSPRTIGQWIRLYQASATSAANRFHTQWIPSLTKLAGDSSVHAIANPLLTCDVLQRLMELLAGFGAAELLLPVICLCQVVYLAFSPHKCKAMEIWIELKLYYALEQLNLAEMSTPLQSALEMLQSAGDLLLKELQQQKNEHNETTQASRRRPILCQSQVDVASKVSQLTRVLLDTGFIRQAKVLLTLLRTAADRNNEDSYLTVRCDALAAHVTSLEGDNKQAMVYIHRVTTSQSRTIDVAVFIDMVLLQSTMSHDVHATTNLLLDAERVVAQATLAANDCILLHQPMHTQAVSKYLASMATSAATSKTSSGESHCDLDAVVALARLKFQRASLMIRPEATRATVEHAQRIFHEATELLALVDSKKTKAACSTKFASLLIDHVKGKSDDLSVPSIQQKEHWLHEARALLHDAATQLEALRSRTFELPDPSVHYTSPICLDIATIKLKLAEVELLLEDTTAIVTDQQMTWYQYERDAKSTIVDQWLDHTAPRVEIERPGSVSQSAALASSAMSLLVAAPEQIEAHCFAKAVQLYSQWLSFYHSGNTDQQKAIQQQLWTRFTSDAAPHETWICAANSGVISSSEGRTTPAPAGMCEGRSTPAPAAEESTPEPQHAALNQSLAALAADVEQELKRALEQRHYDALGLLSYSLVQLHGCSSPTLTARALLLYQSVHVRSTRLMPLMSSCLASTNVTRLHMRRIDQLLQFHTNAKRNSLPYQLSQLYLDQQSDVFKRLDVSAPVENILSLLPSHTRVLSMQLSRNRCFLYVAFADSREKGVAVARMECTIAKLELLEKLKTRIRAWRQNVTKALQTAEEAVSSAPNQAAQSDATEFTAADAVDEVESEFNAIVEGTADFFGSLFDHSALSASFQSELPGNMLVLIVDRELELLPLESLPVLDKADGISRDFSIHMLYHRLLAIKAQPLRRDDVRIIVDPRHEDTGLGDQTLTTVVHQHTRKPGANFSHWKDAVDHGQVPTTTDWQQAMLLRRGGSLCYVGSSRVLGSDLPLETLSGMNLASACCGLLLFDRAENRASARRQSKLDSEKARELLALEEDSHAVVMLCSLCGVNVVLLNQWTISFHANRRLVNSVLDGLGKGQSIATAVHKYPDGVAPVVAAPQARKASTPTTAASGQATASTAKPRLKNRVRFATVVFGLGHLSLKGD